MGDTWAVPARFVVVVLVDCGRVMMNKMHKMDVTNASHRQPAYFEWFYFHFVTDDGAALNMVLHETDIFGLKQQPYLSLSVLLPGREPCYLRRDLAGVEIRRERPFLQVGEGMIEESAWAMCFDIPFPGRGHFRGEITKLAPPLVIQDGILYEEPGTNRASHWVVQIPHATFTGILQVDGQVYRLRGTAYQDHQWGTILIQEFVSDWVWGHFSNEETAVVFFQILTQRGQIIERVAMMNREGRYAGTAVVTNYLDTLFQADWLDDFESDITVSFLNRQLQFDFAIAPANLMRSRLDEEHNQTVASYLRWSAAAALEIGCGYLPLHGISEYIRIRPAMYGNLS
jgi:hypothetical protein